MARKITIKTNQPAAVLGAGEVAQKITGGLLTEFKRGAGNYADIANELANAKLAKHEYIIAKRSAYLSVLSEIDPAKVSHICLKSSNPLIQSKVKTEMAGLYYNWTDLLPFNDRPQFETLADLGCELYIIEMDFAQYQAILNGGV